MTDSSKGPISWKKNLFFVWLSQLLTLIGFAGVMPFIPVYMRERFGIDAANVRGWYVAMFSFFGMLGFAIFTPMWGYLSDKFGRKVMLIRASVGGGVLIPCMAFLPSITWLIVVRFFVSAFSGTINAAQTLLASTTPKEHHGFALGTLSSAIWSGNMLGYLGGGLFVHYFGYKTAFLLCGAAYLLSAFVVIFFVREDFKRPVKEEIPQDLSSSPEKPKRRFALLPAFSKEVYWILALFLMMAFSRRFDEAYLALQVEAIAGKVNTELYTSWISAAAALGGIIAGAGVGYLADKFPPHKVAVPAILLSAVLILGQGFAPSLLVLGGCRFLNFITAGGLEPLFLTMLTKASPEDKRGQIIGWSASFRTGGLVIASLIGGSAIYHFGLKSVYIIAAASFLLILPLLFKILKMQNKHTA